MDKQASGESPQAIIARKRAEIEGAEKQIAREQARLHPAWTLKRSEVQELTKEVAENIRKANRIIRAAQNEITKQKFLL